MIREMVVTNVRFRAYGEYDATRTERPRLSGRFTQATSSTNGELKTKNPANDGESVC